MAFLRKSSTSALLAALLFGLGMGGAVAVAQHDEEDAHGEVGAHGDEHAEGEHGEAHAAGVELDPSRLIGQLVNFALWAGILWYMLKDRIPAFLASRRATIVSELDEAKRMKEEAERKFAEYSERIENLDSELDRMRAEMKQGGLSERDRIVAEAASRGEKMRAEARFLVEQQMKQLKEDLTREAIEAAIGAAEKILRDKTGAPDQERLATEYLDRLSSQLKDGQLKDGPSTPGSA